MFLPDEKRAARYFDVILKCLQERIIIVDAQGTILQCNPAFDALLGYASGELNGIPFINLVHKSEEAQKLTGIAKLHHFKRSSEFPIEMHLMDKQGNVTPIRLRSSLVKDDNNAVIEAIGIIDVLREDKEENRLEQTIWETQETLQNILANTGDAAILVDFNGVVTNVNEALLHMLGYQLDEVIGKHLVELSPFEGTFSTTTGESIAFAEEYQIYQIEKANELFEKGKVTNYELYLIHRDGIVIPVEATISILKDQHGERRGSIALCRDITERRKAEAEIKNTRDFLENIFKTSADGILVSNPRGYISAANEAAEKILGYAAGELIGKHPMEFSTPDKFEKQSLAVVNELMEKGAIADVELVWIKKDRNPICVELNAALLKNTEGQVTGAVTCIRNITERTKAQEALKQSRERYHNLIEFANIGIIVSEQGAITHFNKKASEIYGYTKDEIIGKSPKVLTLDTYQQQHRQMLNEIITSGKLQKTIFEEQGLRKDGSIIQVEISFALIDPASNIIIAAVNDISGRKEMEQRLIQSEKLKSLGELAGGVAHDFNNVLAAILGRAELLRMYLGAPEGNRERRKAPGEIKKGLEVIERAALDGAETVRRIQEFCRRRDTDSYGLAVDLNQVIEHALEFTKTRWKHAAEARGIHIAIKKRLSSAAPVAGNAAELREVFTNLFNNALDAMPRDGTISIETALNNGMVSAVVADSGTGIPASIRDKIFDPFFTTKGPRSTGLGMSVSYGIISRHRGTISVDSEEGRGTTFTIEFPAAEQMPSRKPEAVHDHGQQKATVLVIEDEDDVRELLCDILTSSGHEVVSASRGKEGVAIFQKQNCDLVFTDLGMPGLSGWQVAKEIKQISRDTPIALITGWDLEEKKEESKQNGVDTIITKPFRVEQVLQAVQQLLQQKPGAALH